MIGNPVRTVTDEVLPVDCAYRVPASILDKLSPKLVVIGEAPCEHLNYYPSCDTITQNSAGDITFECVEKWVHVYASDAAYVSDCLVNLNRPDSDEHGWYVGSVAVHAAAAAAA